MVNLYDVYGHDFDLLHWVAFDEGCTSWRCADPGCERPILTSEVVCFVRPPAIIANFIADDCGDLCAPMCAQCYESWFKNEWLEEGRS